MDNWTRDQVLLLAILVCLVIALVWGFDLEF
jgi:hypothetical protein